MYLRCADMLKSRAAEWKIPGKGEWNALFHNNYQPNSSYINLLWFQGNERFPKVVTKACREEALLRHEFNSLQTVHRHLGASVPKPFDLVCDDGWWMLWMAGLPGARMELRRSYRDSDLAPLIEAIASSHRALRQDVGKGAVDRYTRMVEMPLQALAGYPGTSARFRELLAELAQRATPAWLESVPVIPQHGDLFISNILQHKARWYFVDWEGFGCVDLAAYDVITLALSLLRVCGETPQEWNRQTAAIIPGLMHRYMSGIGLPVPAMALLLPLTLANWSHLHWREKRMGSAEKLCRMLNDYFEHTALWNETFGIPNGSSRG